MKDSSLKCTFHLGRTTPIFFPDKSVDVINKKIKLKIEHPFIEIIKELDILKKQGINSDTTGKTVCVWDSLSQCD